MFILVEKGNKYVFIIIFLAPFWPLLSTSEQNTKKEKFFRAYLIYLLVMKRYALNEVIQTKCLHLEGDT